VVPIIIGGVVVLTAAEVALLLATGAVTMATVGLCIQQGHCDDLVNAIEDTDVFPPSTGGPARPPVLPPEQFPAPDAAPLPPLSYPLQPDDDWCAVLPFPDGSDPLPPLAFPDAPPLPPTVFENSGGWPTIKIRDLDPLHSPRTSGRRPDLERLTDAELLEAVRNPRRGDPIMINTLTGKVVQGNGRAYELLRRAADPTSLISPDMEIPYVPYTPDNSLFPDLD
jgi:hypothetical protein